MILTNTEQKKSFEETKEELKKLIRQLKGNESNDELEKIKLRFKNILKDANPLVIAMAENELVKEGYKIEDLMSACEIHLMLFKESIENPDLDVPEWHPIHHFHLEHKAILNILEKLRGEIKKARLRKDFENASDEIDKIRRIALKLMEAENHNIRQENTLFPVLEKHGIEQPPAIMWAEHTEMKEQKKELLKILERKEHTEMKEQKKELLKILERKNDFPFDEFLRILDTIALRLTEKFALHTQKEEHILYVTALQVISEEEWKEIKEECDQLGYFEFEII